MHTFFVNTSGKKLDGYEVLFDTHYENRALVSMHCGMKSWYDPEKGYAGLVKRMSDMIDSYTELNNAYNLIIYIDLTEIEAYANIRRDAFHDKEREVCLAAMHTLFSHVVTETIVEELVTSGRRPQDILVMFGEDKKFFEFDVDQSDSDRLLIMGKLFGFLGLPDAETVVAAAKVVDASAAEDKVDELRALVSAKFTDELIPGSRARYNDALELWFEEIVGDADVDKANRALFERIDEIRRAETERIGIKKVSCPSDYHADTVSKSAFAVSRLNLACYLLRCVDAGSIYEEVEVAGTPVRRVMEFRAYGMDELAPLLELKRSAYAKKLKEIESLDDTYTKLSLAPELYAFDHGRFGMDEHGARAADLIVTDAEKAEEDEKKQDAADEASVVIADGVRKEVVVSERRMRPLFTREEFEPFDYKFDSGGDEMLKKNTSPEQYIEQAKKVRRHHLDYLKRLKVHLTNVLANYAGRSEENEAALLRKRRVSVAEEGFDDPGRDYKYATPAGETETKKLKTVQDISGTAYETALLTYLEFCATRSVAVTDIEEQCNWFVSRVHQIRESLKKLRLVAIGMLAALVLLYLPFIVIQWEAITENLMTVPVALGSLAVPVVILYLVFAALALAQRKKYLQAWKEFKERSDKVLEENGEAVEKYDRLLSTIVPSLRWLYEYMLDVDFYAECCKLARAKLGHHTDKLRDRVVSIGNMIEDMEVGDAGKAASAAVDGGDFSGDIDYNAAFCFGEKNRSFYSVIDTLFLDSLKGRKGA